MLSQKMTDTLDELESAEKRLADLRRQLANSLAVKAVWPEAFTLGGNVGHGWTAKGGKIYARFTRRADGAVHFATRCQLPSTMQPSAETVAYYRKNFPSCTWAKPDDLATLQQET